MARNQPARQLCHTFRPTILRLHQQHFNWRMQPSLDILANRRDSNQLIAENETRQGAAMVRTLGRRIVRKELNPIRVVDFEEESEVVRANLRSHGGLESSAVGDVEERGGAN